MWSIKNGFWNRTAIRAALCALALGCVSLTAGARDLDRYSDLSWLTNGSSAQGLPAPGTGPTSFKAAGSSGATAGGKKALPWPGKSQAENMAKWKALASPRDMAKGLMKPGGPVTLLGGMAMKQLVDAACVQVFGGVLVEGAVWDECRFTEVQGYVTSGYQPSLSSTRSSSCTLFVGLVLGGAYNTVVRQDGANYFCDTYNKNPPYNNVSGYGISLGNPVLVVDPTNPWKPATTAVVEDKVTNQLTTWCQADFTAGLAENTGKCAGVLSEVLTVGMQTLYSVDQPLTGPPTYTGPLEQNVVNWTKTNPDGSTETAVTTTTTQDVHTYGYVGNTVTDSVSKKTTTTTSTPTGTTTTTEAADSGAKDPSQDTTKTDCERNPNTAGCAELDTPAGEIPRTTATVTYTEENLFGDGSCPAQVTAYLGTLGATVTVWDWASLCNKALPLRALIIALASFAAFLIIMPNGKVAP